MALLLGIAFAVALVTTGIFYGLLSSRMETADASSRFVVAGEPLPPGKRLEAKHLRIATAARAPSGGFADINEVLGKAPAVAIGVGAPLTASLLVNAPRIPAGQRGISLRVADSSGLIEMIEPGSRVDVQVIYPDRARGDFRSTTMASNLEVVSVSAASEGKPVVNLIIPPALANDLALADSTARVRLLLRNPLDPAVDGRGSTAVQTGVQ